MNMSAQRLTDAWNYCTIKAEAARSLYGGIILNRKAAIAEKRDVFANITPYLNFLRDDGSHQTPHLNLTPRTIELFYIFFNDVIFIWFNASTYRNLNESFVF